MKRLLTGIQPSGVLHIGNYLGAIKQIVELQKDYDTYVMIADLHALTTLQDPQKYQDQILNLAATLIASGIDSSKTTLFAQSAIPAHAQLAWIFSTITSIGELERMTQYKEKSDKHGQNAGLLTYPVLQAADILLYHPEVVPVGEDQVQHLELTRVIARKFNSRYGKTFSEPKTLLTKSARIMALNNPAGKMSKSVIGSGVGMDDSEAEVRKAIMGAVTDTSPGGEMTDGVKNLFALLEGFAPKKVAEFEKAHNDKTIKYSELKTELADAIFSTLATIQQKKQTIVSNKTELKNILARGNKKAAEIASQTITNIYQKTGLL